MVTTISFTTIGLPVVLLCVYLLHYCVFTCCTTVCLPVALPFVYVLCYRLFTFCTTVCLPFALPSVYIFYYFLLRFCTTVRRTTAVSGVRRITFRAKTSRASVCRRSAGRPNECPSAVVRLSIPLHKYLAIDIIFANCCNLFHWP